MKPAFNRALAVGALVAVCGVAFLIAFTFFRKGGYSEKESYLVHAYFRDATGLTWKSRVQIAGIQVGEVDQIGLEGPRARLTLRIKNDVPLHADACLYKTFPSALLPDAVLEVVPGSPDAPLFTDLPAERREITCVREATTVQQLVDAMAQIAADVQKVTGDLSKTVDSDRGSMRNIVENLAQLTGRLDGMLASNEGRINAILANTQRLSGDLADISSGERERVHAIARNLEQVSEQMKRVLAGVEDIVGTSGAPGAPGASPASRADRDVVSGALPSGAGGRPGGGTSGGPGVPAIPPGAAARAEQPLSDQAKQVQGLRQAIERLNTTLARVDNIVEKVEEGKSVAGKILVDERTGRQLGSAVEGVADYLDRLTKLQVEVNLRSEWLLNQTGAKSYFGARLLPRPDKFYLVELVSDPRGEDTVTTETITTRDPATGNESTTTSTKTKHEDKLKFSAQIGKRYGPVTFRVGVIESSGGIGSDLHLLDDRFQLSMSVYQFSRPYQDVFPRTKVWVNYNFLQHFYLTAGADDFFNRWRSGRYPGGPKFTIGNDVFFGGGLFFTDDDLKAFIASGGASSAGSL